MTDTPAPTVGQIIRDYHGDGDFVWTDREVGALVYRIEEAEDKQDVLREALAEAIQCLEEHQRWSASITGSAREVWKVFHIDCAVNKSLGKIRTLLNLIGE